MNLQHLDNIISSSVVRQHERGLRRYFPVPSNITDINSDESLDYAIFIITGTITPSDPLKAKFNRGMAILNCIDKYLEEFDNSLWVRTIYKPTEQ